MSHNSMLYRFAPDTVTLGALLIIVLLGVNTDAIADGESVYTEHCGSCHNGGFKGFMARAPKIGKDSAWTERFADGLEQTQSGILSGAGKHKAMGEEAGLSADQVNEAIDYILSQTTVPDL